MLLLLKVEILELWLRLKSPRYEIGKIRWKVIDNLNNYIYFKYLTFGVCVFYMYIMTSDMSKFDANLLFINQFEICKGSGSEAQQCL